MLKWTVTKRPEPVESIALVLDPNRTTTRRSLGNLHRPIRNRDIRESRRKTLGSTESTKRYLNQNKENQLIATPLPLTLRNTTSTPFSQVDYAFRDVSNITPTSTPVISTARNQKRNLPLSPVTQPTQTRPQYASTLPTFDIEYSPCGINSGPLIALRGLTGKRTYFENSCYFRDEMPATKRLKFSPEVTPLSKRLSELRFSKISFKRSENVNNNNITTDDDSIISSKALNDTELDKMIDAILESSRKTKLNLEARTSVRKRKMSIEESPTYAAADDPAADLNKFCDTFQISPNKVLEAGERTIILDETNVVNEREVRTPDSISKFVCQTVKNNLSECHLRRQRGVRRKHKLEFEKCEQKSIKINDTSSPETPKIFLSDSFTKNIDRLAGMNTPKEIYGVDNEISIKKLKGITSNGSKKSYESTPGIKTNDLQGSSTPTGAQQAIRRCLTFSESPDSMEDSLDKRKSVASSTTSRYSKSSGLISGSLDLAMFADDDKIQIHVIRCKELSRPNGGSINAYVKVALLPNDTTNENGFQRTAVQRNSMRPFFDHRFIFGRTEYDQNKRIQLAVWHRDRECKRSEFLGCMSFPLKNVINKEINGSFKLQPQSCLTTPVQPVAMCENSQSSVEEVISIEEGATGAADRSSSYSTIPLSKKAIHQRDADENLFLRFLELDPPTDTPSVDVKSTPIEQRRKSVFRLLTGRTPFTITKKLVRSNDKGFGFSIVWTHPPRIEKVEPGMSADKSGILPGDFVIFVDKHNVVTMPEIDILNLIRSQGNTLLIEIFRRSHSHGKSSNGIKSRVPSLISNNQMMVDHQTTPKQSSMHEARPSTACSNSNSYSIETTKRRLNLPQVTFSKEVGQGVIV